MTHWFFIAAAYGVTLAGLAATLITSWRAMREAEARADALAGR